MNIQPNEQLSSAVVDKHSITAVPSLVRKKYQGFEVPFSERRVLLGLGDAFLIMLAVLAAFWLWPRTDSLLFDATDVGGYWYWFPILLIGWWTLAWLNDLYDIPSSSYRILSISRIAIVGILFMIIYLVVFFLAPRTTLPRLFFIYFLLIALPAIALWRWTYAVVFSAPPFRHRVLIVGAGTRGRTIAGALKQEPLVNYQVLGYVDDHLDTEGATLDGLPVLGRELDLPHLVQQLQVHEIVVAIEANLERELFQWLVECQANGTRVSWMPDLYEKLCRRIPIQHIDPAWALQAMQGQARFYHLKPISKRLLDLALVLGGMPIFILVLPLLAVAIRLDSPGPIFYRQVRCGRAGKPFSILKFRTMSFDAEKDGKPRWATRNDSRITRVGHLLRKSRLDELPQLLNVLRGDMSIVGPRPERPEFVEKLEREIPFYRTRLIAKPGITGWAQVHYDYGNTVEDALVKLQYDFYYIRYQSLALDIYTMFRTVGVLLRLKGT